MTRDQAIQRIKKCLALRASSNEHEAAAALRQAQALMREHHITDSHVAASEATEASCRSGVQSKPPIHIVALARTVANAFACDIIFNETIKGLEVTFIGVDPAPELATYAYTVLRRALERDRRDFLATQTRCRRATKIRRGRTFALAWCYAVSRKVREFAGSDKDRERNAAYIEHRYRDSLVETEVTSHKVQGRDAHAANAGMDKGGQQQLRHGVGPADEARRLGLV